MLHIAMRPLRESYIPIELRVGNRQMVSPRRESAALTSAGTADTIPLESPEQIALPSAGHIRGPPLSGEACRVTISAMRIACLFLAFLAMLQAQPPAAKRSEFRETFHGSELVDHYHWLENFDDEEQNPGSPHRMCLRDLFSRSFLVRKDCASECSSLSARDRLTTPRVHPVDSSISGIVLRYRNPLECYRDGAAGVEKVWLDPADVAEGLRHNPPVLRCQSRWQAGGIRRTYIRAGRSRNPLPRGGDRYGSARQARQGALRPCFVPSGSIRSM